MKRKREIIADGCKLSVTQQTAHSDPYFLHCSIILFEIKELFIYPFVIYYIGTML